MTTASTARGTRGSALTARLVAYMAAAGRRRLPLEVIEKTKHHIVDSIAAMISGTRLDPGRLAIGFVTRQGGVAEASVVGTRDVTSAINAALANGMTAHADETDDSHQPAFYHPGCAIVPAALAVAERERASGAALIRAVALGYDIGSRFNFALGAMRFHLSGRSTHSFGALFGAAAAAGSAAGLSPQQMRYLLSYTAQQASGISCWMRDPHHVEKAFDFGGMPARNGVAAALMVAHGMTGVEDVLSGERNFLFAFGAEKERRPGVPADRAGAERLVSGLGSVYEVLNANIKKWSVGSPIQAALDSTQALLLEHELRAEQIGHLRVEVQDHEAAIVDNRSMPDICLQHLVAVLLTDRQLTFASSHDTGRMADPKIRALRRRIELVGSAALTKAGGRQAIVTAELRDGRQLSHHTRVVKGTPGDPMTRADVEDKYLDLAAPVLTRRRAAALVARLWELETVTNVRALRPLLQPASRRHGSRSG